MKHWFKSGSPWIWMTGGAVSISLISVIGLLALIAGRGLGYFWPSEVTEFQIQRGDITEVVIGEIYDRELVPTERLKEAGVDLKGFNGEHVERLLIKTGNRE